MVEISILTREDCADLKELLSLVNGEEFRGLAQQYTQSMFSDDFRKPTFLIAKKENKIIGALAFSEEIFTVETWGISWVSVHPAFRKQGIAKKMLMSCMQTIKERAKATVTVILCTHPDKTKLYDDLGFISAGKDHEGGTFMLKVLS